MDDIRDFEAKDGADHVGLRTKSVDDLHEESMMPPGLSEAAFRQLPSAYRKKMPKAKSIYVLDFFAGCGGMSYGFATTRQSRKPLQNWSAALRLTASFLVAPTCALWI